MNDTERIANLLQQVEALKSNVEAQVNIEIRLLEENERLRNLLKRCDPLLSYQGLHAFDTIKLKKEIQIMLNKC